MLAVRHQAEGLDGEKCNCTAESIAFISKRCSVAEAVLALNRKFIQIR